MIRILGSKLDVGEYYLDVAVKNVNLDGEVHLEEATATDPRTWTVDMDDLDGWRDRHYAVKHENLADPNHQIWTTLNDLYTVRDDPVIEDIATTLDANSEDLFRTVVRSMTA